MPLHITSEPALYRGVMSIAQANPTHATDAPYPRNTLHEANPRRTAAMKLPVYYDPALAVQVLLYIRVSGGSDILTWGVPETKIAGTKIECDV